MLRAVAIHMLHSGNIVITVLDIQNQTVGFPKLFVVSMKDRYDKHDLWSLASLYSNITYEYVDSVPGAAIPEQALHAGWIQDKPEDDTNTIGCESKATVGRQLYPVDRQK